MQTFLVVVLPGKSTEKVCTDRGGKNWCRLERWWHFGSNVVWVWGLLSGQAKIHRVVQGPYGNCLGCVAMLAGWLADCLAGWENWVLGEGVSVVAWGASAGPFPSPSFPGTQQKPSV